MTPLFGWTVGTLELFIVALVVLLLFGNQPSDRPPETLPLERLRHVRVGVAFVTVVIAARLHVYAIPPATCGETPPPRCAMAWRVRAR